jgi:multiple sugar transport system ATP-binding protein
MRAELATLHRQLEATMIYVTHDQVEAMTLGDRIVVLDAGVIQQIDTPLELYDRPANRFVAGFLGSPAMNFVEGRVVDGDGLRFRADGDGFEVPLPDRWAPTLAAHRDDPVTLGIRPENIFAAGARPDDAPVADVPVVLEALEPLGNEIFIHAASGDHRITARVPPGELPPPGSATTLGLDLRHLHFFGGPDLRAIRP